MRHIKLISIIVSALLIIGGDLLYYYNSYRHWGGRPALGGIMIFLGTLMLIFVVFRKWIFANEVSYDTDKRRWFFYKLKYWASIFIGTAFAFLNINISSELAYKRVDDILKNRETKESIATVIKLDVKHFYGRGSSTITYQAFIKYNTTSGIITQDINNDCQCHYIGEQMKIKYSVAYPELFCLID